MEEETTAAEPASLQEQRVLQSTDGNPGDLNVSNAMAASSEEGLEQLEQHKIDTCGENEKGIGEEDKIGICEEDKIGICEERKVGICEEHKIGICEEECDGKKNGTSNIKIRVSSTDEFEFGNEDEEPCKVPLKSSNPVGGVCEKRPIKLQRSDAQDDDASLIDTVDTTNTDIESIARDMKMLNTSTSTETQDPNNRKKSNLSLLSSQGSGGSVETTSSPCLSRDSSSELYTDSTGIDLEKFLIDSLQSKDRLFLLNIEKEVISFIKSADRESYQFERMNTYHRMLVHRVAAFFGLDHNVDKATESVIVTKTKNTRLPELKFDDVQVVRIEGVEGEHLPKKVLKRSDFSGCSLDKSPDRIREGSGLKGSKSSSYEERHEKYVETRARIFAEKGAQKSSGSEEASTSSANTSGANTSGANTSSANTSSANTSSANICGDDPAGECGTTANSSQDDVSRSGEKAWSSVDSESPSCGQVCPPRRSESNNGNRLLVPGVKKARSFEEKVSQGSASKLALSRTKAASLNETSSGVVCDPHAKGERDSWHHHKNSSGYHPSSYSFQHNNSTGYNPSSYLSKSRLPNTAYWNTRTDLPPRPRGPPPYRPRPHPGHQPWTSQSHDPRQLFFIPPPSHSNPRFMKDQSHQQGEMILHQVANILGSGQSTSDQQQMQNAAANAGLFYQPVTGVAMQVAPQSVQVTSGQHHSSHSKNRRSAAGNLCNGSGQWQGGTDGRNNVQQSQPITFPSSQQVFQGQVPNVTPGQIDPRFLYLNCPQPQTAPTQYSVQSTTSAPFSAPTQNYVLMPTQTGIRPQVNFQPMTGQSVGMQPSQVAFLPTGQPVMLQNGSNVSNGAALLPLPFPGPFQCQPVPQNFQMQPPPNAAMTFKNQPQQQQPNQTPPLVLGTNSSPAGGGVTLSSVSSYPAGGVVTSSSVSSYLPSGHLIVANPQPLNQNNHHLNSPSQSNQQIPVFYGHQQMCPNAPPPNRFRPHHPRGGHNHR